MANKMSDHLDKSVIKLFIIVFFISASILAYRATKYTPCKGIDFEIKSKDFVVGKLIQLKDKTENANSWEWDFGDNSKVYTEKNPLHSYNKAGKYNVTLKVNGICVETKSVTIKEKPFVIDETKLAVFDLPETIDLGEELNVRDQTKDASSWEWNFGETSGINSTEKNAKYVFESDGLKTVVLVVNGDLKHKTSKQIRVLKNDKEEFQEVIAAVGSTTSNVEIKDKPTGIPMGGEDDKLEDDDDGAPKTIPNISEAQFKTKLQLVAKKKARPDDFEIYFCGDLDKTIIVNGEKISFLQFCELLKIKKFKIKDVQLNKDDNNCIKNVTIIRSKYII